MFTPETIIDSIQSAKKQVVNTFVTDKKFQAELHKLVDAQTEFVKGSYKSSLAIAEALVKNAGTQFYSFVPASK